MYNLTFEPEYPMIHLTFSGHVIPDEVRQCRAEIETMLQNLSSGFSLLTDLSTLEVMDYACTEGIRSVMDQFRKGGVGHIIRVIPDPKKDIGFNIMSIFHYPHEVDTRTVTSLTEALGVLRT